MRLLVVSNLFPPQVIGGYELICSEVVDGLRERGHEVEVLTCRGEIVPGQDHVRRELELHMEGGKARHSHPLRRLPDEVRDHRALAAVPDWDVALVFHMFALSKSLLTRLHQRGPVAYVLADVWPGWDLVTDTWLGRLHPGGPPGTPPTGIRRLRHPSLLARAIAPLARRSGVPTEWPDLYREGAWLAGSRWIADHLTGHRKLPLETVRLVPIGLPLEIFPPRSADPGGRRLLYVGRVTADKGVDVALDAVQRVEGASLTMVGPADPAFMRRTVIPPQAELRDPVERDELAPVYAEHDVCLFPVAWSEPFGMVPLEAMAVGTPVVATGTGGSGEFLEHERNCLLVEPGNSAMLAEAVRRILDDDALRERLAAGGRATAERYSMDRMTGQVESAARQLAEESTVTAGEPVSALG